MPKISKISGPPGTGKTTYLLRQIENACRKYNPDRIGAVSFSKASVEEIRARVKEQLPGSLGRNIKTIHALCFQLLGLKKSMVIDESSAKVKEWNETFPVWGLPVSAKLSDLEDDPNLQAEGYSVTENRKRMARIGVLRGTLTPKDRWPDDCRAMYRDWTAWCKENEYWDFTRMLEEVYKLKLSPSIDLLFVDEAQDLSSLQLAITHQWATDCESAVWIGDPDQAIYRFSGAVPEDFRDLKVDWSHVLSQSYRVPVSVHEYALRLIRGIGDRREDISYLPTDVPGNMSSGRRLFPDLSLPGSHMILTRCQYHLKRWQKYLINKGIPWHNPYRDAPGWNPAESKLWKAVQTYDGIARGLEVYGQDVTRMIGLMYVAGNLEPGIKVRRKKLLANPYDKHDAFSLSDRGWFTPEWFQFKRPLDSLFNLDGIAGDFLRLHGKEIVRQEPKVMIGTGHSFKGAEADHTHIDMTSSPTIARSIMENQQARDDEIRLAYTMVTRSRKTCSLLAPFGLPNNVFI